MSPNNLPHEILKDIVSGRIERGEAEAIVEIPACAEESPEQTPADPEVLSAD